LSEKTNEAEPQRVKYETPVPVHRAQPGVWSRRAGKLVRTARMKPSLLPLLLCFFVTAQRFYSWSHHVAIRIYDESGIVIATHEHVGEFKEPW